MNHLLINHYNCGILIIPYFETVVTNNINQSIFLSNIYNTNNIDTHKTAPTQQSIIFTNSIQDHKILKIPSIITIFIFLF